MSPASPMEDRSGDPLDGFLTDLSLTDARQTTIVRREPSGFNPFDALLRPALETGPVENDNDGGALAAADEALQATG